MELSRKQKYHQEYYIKNRDTLLPRQNKRSHELRNGSSEGRLRSLIIHAKTRSKKQDLPFNLSFEDLELPEYCPITKEKIDYEPGNKAAPNSPSLDRVIPELGYTKENVRLVSWRGNRLKYDGTLQEFKNLVAYLESISNSVLSGKLNRS